jgi:hypothetical protein
MRFCHLRFIQSASKQALRVADDSGQRIVQFMGCVGNELAKRGDSFRLRRHL